MLSSTPLSSSSPPSFHLVYHLLSLSLISSPAHRIHSLFLLFLLSSPVSIPLYLFLLLIFPSPSFVSSSTSSPHIHISPSSPLSSPVLFEGLLEDERLASAHQAEAFTRQIQNLQGNMSFKFLTIRQLFFFNFMILFFNDTVVTGGG